MCLRRHLTCLVALGVVMGCARPVRMAPVPLAATTCRDLPSAAARLDWLGPDDPRQRQRLDRWCSGVGRPDLRAANPGGQARVGRLVVVSWNLHVGRGDVLRLVDDLQRGCLGPPPDAIVLLLQEAWRKGGTIPASAPRQARVASRLTPPPGSRPASDISEVAVRLGWSLVYVPSMRNGRTSPDGVGEDRGSAVLGSIPLEAPQAVELPVERQRRVAVTSVVAGLTPAGRPWTLRVVSAHLENRPGPGRGWIRAAAARTRQVEALLRALETVDTKAGHRAVDAPLLLGGDLNTWRGGRENALRLLRRALPAAGPDDSRPTFGRWRLDYLFGRLPPGTTMTRRRLDDAYGSDHHPVVAEIDFRGLL